MIKEIEEGKKAGREIDENKAENIFKKLMKKISDEGWRIISVNEVGGIIFYTLEREITQ